MKNISRKTADKPRKTTNVSINELLLTEARALKINVSKAVETGLALALAEKRTELWLVQNQSALESSNDYVEQNGLPLAQYRGHRYSNCLRGAWRVFAMRLRWPWICCFRGFSQALKA
ncbi:type II toxin-antitoxin system CcdA family antitoxin [Propionivibrio sp.]|uniref:type II toxin-antitoxin system CcdA family antitoxin n=1 Tax=Propionivibrio sp. TaxID=2212460 RepID=UPI003BF004B5